MKEYKVVRINSISDRSNPAFVLYEVIEDGKKYHTAKHGRDEEEFLLFVQQYINSLAQKGWRLCQLNTFIFYFERDIG